MTSIELEEIRLEHQMLEKEQELLRKREREVLEHYQDAASINDDTTLIKSDVKPEEANYILGQSQGFVDGFRSAIDNVVNELAFEHRDTMSERELYMLVELGAIRERAWLKNYKQKEIMGKSGWELSFAGRCPTWRKKEEPAEV